MAITGLPLVLENVLGAIMTSHDLGTWSIFNEKSGEITVRLKFKNQGEGRSAIPDASYRRKSQNQVVRDKARAVRRKRLSTTDNVQC